MATQLKHKADASIFIDSPMTDGQDLTPNTPTDNDITTQIINASSSDTLENSVGGAAENPVDSANGADTQPAGFAAAKIHYSAALNSAAPVISDTPASIDSDPSSPDSSSDVENSETYTFDESNLIAGEANSGRMIMMSQMVSHEQLRQDDSAVDPDLSEQATVDDTAPVDSDLPIEETYSDEYFTEDGNAEDILSGDTEQPTDADVIGTDGVEEPLENYETFNDGLLDEDRRIYIVDDTAAPLAEWTEFVPGSCLIAQTYSDEYFTKDYIAGDILSGDTKQSTDEDIIGTDSEEATADVLIDDWVEEPVEDYETPNDGTVVDEDNSIVDDTADSSAEWTEVDPDSYLIDEPIDSNTDPLVATTYEPLLIYSYVSCWTTDITLTFDQGILPSGEFNAVVGNIDAGVGNNLSLRDTPIERLQGGDINLSASGSFEINTHRLLMPEHSLPELDWRTFNVSTADSVHFNQDSTPDNGGIFSGDLELAILGLPIATVV